MKKKKLTILLASLSLLLAACGGSKGKNSSDSSGGGGGSSGTGESADTSDGNNSSETTNTSENSETVVNNATLNFTTKAIKVDETFELVVSDVPDGMTPVWSKTGTAVSYVLSSAVSATSATVTGVEVGEATINVVVGEKTLSCAVNVSANDVAPVVNHQTPFVTTVENPSVTRAYNEDFDAMLEDFSSETPNGTTTGVFNKSFLRVLVDSEDVASCFVFFIVFEEIASDSSIPSR